MRCPVCRSTHVKRVSLHTVVLCVGWNNPRRIKDDVYECADCGETFDTDTTDVEFPLNFDHDYPEFDAYMYNPYEMKKSYM